MTTDLTLVTGATGFIGGRLLQKQDRALVRFPLGLSGEVVGDLTDPESVRRACDGVKRVFHCAGFAHAMRSRSNDNLHNAINFEATRDLVWEAGRAGVRIFVFLSSVKAMAEPGDACVDETWRGIPSDPYGLAKRRAETEVVAAGKAYGMHVVNLRLAMVYGRGGRGNLARMARGIKAGWFPPIPETGNRRSLVHVDDVVSAVRHVAGKPEANGKTYIIAHLEAPSGREIYDAMTRSFCKAPVRWRVPAGLLRTAGLVGDVCPRGLGFGNIINSEAVSKLLDSGWYSPVSIERDLGWQAEFDLEAGLNEMFGDETGF